MLSSGKVRKTLFAAIILAVAVSIYLFNQSPEIKYNEQGGSGHVSYEKAKVLKVVSENLEKDAPSGMTYGTQELEIEISSGERKGEIHTIKNYMSSYNNVYAQEGQSIVVNVNAADAKSYMVSVYSPYRAPYLLAMALLFFGLLWWIGGMKGLKSALGIIFTFACIIFLFIPMLYRGYSPIFASVLIVVLTTCITLLLLNGWSTKSAAAIFGTLIGITIAGLLAYIFGEWVQISGFNTNEVEVLLVVAEETGLQLKGLLFAGILLATLGAVIDVGISIASSIHEVYMTNRSLSKKELFMSGINVGRDMMGTMANTLLLAFTGTSLTSLILLYSIGVTFTQATNMNMVTIEVVQGITGCIGVVLTVPIVAFISSRIIPKYEKSTDQPDGQATSAAAASTTLAAASAQEVQA
ncbi:YibE/F family protein [Paenibacillus sp. GCM10027626]|uniref:YibE/F family protein n=1 Tax=Paenibacillus sp. GCM10027626 TaxID=3273411 RepID=UPI00364271B8